MSAGPLRHIDVPGLPPLGRYSQAVVAPHAQLAFVAGQVAVRDGAVVAPGDAEIQTAVVFEHLGVILEALQAGWADIVFLRGFVTSIQAMEGYGRVRQRFLASPPPATTSVVVAGLAMPGLVLELEAVVRVPGAG